MSNKVFGSAEIKLLLDATFKIIDSNKSSKDPSNILAETQFLNMYVEYMLHRMFNDKTLKDKTKKAQFEYLKNNFGNLKFNIQNSIAMAFQTSMERFTRVPVEYYCIIKTIQDSESKLTH